MGHSTHKVTDLDPMFVVDAETRAIVSMSDKKTQLMQYDHDSERVTFAVPRYREEHDMSLCKSPAGRVEIHYINGKGGRYVYEVTDLETYKDDDNTEWVTFSWLISGNATEHEGSLSFLLRFICGSDDEFDYVWSTAICSDITIGKGIKNDETVATQYADILAKWYNEFIAAGNNGVARIENATSEALEEMAPEIEETINTTLESAVAAILSEADEIVNTVLERLPSAEEASF